MRLHIGLFQSCPYTSVTFKIEQENKGLTPTDGDGKALIKNVDFVDTWRAMEECVDKGLVRSIGVSNFNSQQLKRLMEHCRIKPVTNQIEAHVYLNQKKMIELCKTYDVVVTAYGPLGRPGFQKDSSEPVLIQDPQILKLAAIYGRTPAQIALRYLVRETHLLSLSMIKITLNRQCKTSR